MNMTLIEVVATTLASHLPHDEAGLVELTLALLYLLAIRLHAGRWGWAILLGIALVHFTSAVAKLVAAA